MNNIDKKIFDGIRNAEGFGQPYDGYGNGLEITRNNDGSIRGMRIWKDCNVLVSIGFDTNQVAVRIDFVQTRRDCTRVNAALEAIGLPARQFIFHNDERITINGIIKSAYLDWIVDFDPSKIHGE
jgi:hypothetical protein